VKSLLKDSVCRILFVAALISVSALVQAADIVFTGSSRIQGDQVFLYFNGYGSTYQQSASKYTVSVETSPASATTIRVQDAAAAYLYCVISPAASTGQQTTVTLNYDNGDCGKVVFNGSTFSSTESCDSEDPEWIEDPSFVSAGKRMAQFSVKGSDDVGIDGFNVVFDGCEQVFVPVEKTTQYDGVISVALPVGCPDLDDVSTSAELYIKDTAGRLSQSKSVSGIVKTETEPTMTGAECQPNYYKSSISLAVSAQKGSSDIAKYHIVCSSPAVDKYVDGTDDCTITVDGLASDKSYTFKVWAVDEKGLQSENYITATTNCITASEPGIISNLKESYAFRGSEVKLTAVGFDAGASFVWESADSEEGPWTQISGSKNSVIVYPLIAGSNFYRVTAEAGGVGTTVSITILAKISCDVTGAAGQQLIWSETFSDSTFVDPQFDRFRCPWVKGYEFQESGKVDDGTYVVVANSNAADPDKCAWAYNKPDHTSGDGTSGFLIINAGTPEKVMYEQAITPEQGFCSGVYYNFSLYATNISPTGTCPARFSFDIIETLKGSSDSIYLVKRHDSGLISYFGMSQWAEYGVSFEPKNIDKLDKIVVRIWNTGACVDGNDVCIDDITVSICKPTAAAFIGEQSEGKKEESSVSCGTAVELNAVVNGYIGDFFTNTPYYLWQKQLSGSTEWIEVDGEHTKTYMYTTDASEVAKFRCLIASDEATARLVISGTSETGCGTYAWTDELSVKCNDNCDYPASVTWVETSGGQTQSVCDGSPITEIQFQLGGSATGFSIEGLPAGLFVSPEPGEATTTSTITISGTPTANGTFKITTIGQQFPCTAATISGTVAVIETPVPVISGDDVVCAGSTTQLTASIDGGLWSSENSNIATVDEVTGVVSGVSEGRSKINYTLSVGSCQGTASKMIEVAALPVVIITPSEAQTLTCSKESVLIEAVAQGGSQSGYLYSWNNGEYTSSANYEATLAGDYSVRVKDSNDCVSDASQPVSISEDKKKPQFEISSESTELTCTVEEIELLAQATDGGQYSFQWKDGPATANYKVTVANTYYVTAKNETNGCTEEKSIVITKNIVEPQLTVSTSTGGTELNCKYETITLTAQADNSTFVWYDRSQTETQGATLVVTCVGTYSVIATEKTSKCTSTKDITITENKEVPSVYIEPESPEITCETPEVTLRAVATGVSYKWSSQETTESIKVRTGGVYEVTVTDIANGCSSTDEVEVADDRKFTEVKLNADFPSGSSADNYPVGAGEVTIEAEIVSGENPYKIEWYVNDKLVQSSEDTELSITPYTDSKVKAVAYSLCNASDDAIDIKVAWPTIVTPHNVDGQNDDFVVGTDIEIRLFDRTGNMVYHGGDGVPADVLAGLQPTVYYYQAVLPDGNVRKSTLEVYKK